MKTQNLNISKSNYDEDITKKARMKDFSGIEGEGGGILSESN